MSNTIRILHFNNNVINQDFNLHLNYGNHLSTTPIKKKKRHKLLVVKDLLVKRGESIIWLANSLHGGARVLDFSKTRYSQVTHYHFEGCKYYNPNFSDRYKGNIVFREISEHIIK